MIDAPAAAALERCLEQGGVAVFPADTVYGLACDATSARGVERLYALKGRARDKPAAVMWFERERALAALPELPAAVRAVAERLLPGAVTLLLANPARRFPLACRPAPDTLGIRVPALTPATGALAAVTRPVLQSSANAAGGGDPRTLGDVPVAIRAAADLVLDAGALPGTASTVVDLRELERGRRWSVVRHGAVGEDELRALIES